VKRQHEVFASEELAQLQEGSVKVDIEMSKVKLLRDVDQ